MMSEESTTPDLVELTRRAFEAGGRRDFDAVLSFYTPDAVWETPNGGVGPFKGALAIRTFMEDWTGTYEDYRLEVEELLNLGHGVVFIAYQDSGRLTGSEGRVRQRRGCIAVFVGGLISNLTFLLDPDEARAAAEHLAKERADV